VVGSRNRGKKKPSLRDLTRKPPTGKEIEAVANALSGAPTIVAAILGMALVENPLDELLRNAMGRKDDRTWETLTDDKGPLDTVFRKITLGYGLGLYDFEFSENLHIVRRIRNTFAHARRPLEFDNELIVAEFGKIKPPDPKMRRLYAGLWAAHKVHDGPRAAYERLCFSLANEMWRMNLRRARSERDIAKRRLAEMIRSDSIQAGSQ
jgi:hypothetical protein